MTANPKSDGIYMSKDEYLEFLINSEVKYESINGEVIAMAGAKPNHNRLTMRLSRLIDTHLDDKNCEVFGGDQRLEIEKLKSSFFPDLSVVCGDVQFTEDSLPAILDPILIIEVLSSSTESFDRGKKFQMYRQLNSLREYALVSQDSARIERFYLNENDIWEFSDTVGLDASITLKSIDCTLSLAALYQHVTFEDEDAASG